MQTIYGRYWARISEAVELLRPIWRDFLPLLQGLLVDVEGVGCANTIPLQIDDFA
jgi:hypothetical protein